MRRFTALIVLFGAVGRAQTQDAAPKPNILWITCEDISPNLGCYGDAYAVTPNLDRLATQGVRYTNAFAPIGVCAPSRSTLIMGTFASSVGTHHMRCNGTLPSYIKCFPEYLRRAGYYCTNNAKTDYNFNAPASSWDESSNKAHWKGRKAGQPFFSVFNFTSSHESQIRGGMSKAYVHDPDKAPVPPYHPDAPEVRRDWARYADCITHMDKEAGKVLSELDAEGLAADTIVFYFSDHGAGMPRGKRWLYDSSTQVPFIVRFPEKYKQASPGEPGSTTDRLVSFVDFGPTVLSLLGVKVPDHMQGKPFLGGAAAPPREYVYGFRDRMDERTDMLRSVRDKRFKYLRNYMPHRPYAQHVSYMYEMPTMKVWQRLYSEGKLTGPQKFFFEAKPVEELYDTQADPWEIRNLADDPAHRDTLDRMRKALRDWMIEIRDLGFLAEQDLRDRFKGAPHEAVRADPKSYPLERLIDAADLASRRDSRALDLLKDEDAALRFWGATALVALGEKAPLEAARKALEDASPTVRVAAADALCALGKPEEALPVLIRALREGGDWTRLQAADVLDRLGEKARPALDALKSVEKDKNQYVQRVVEHALRNLK